MLTSDAVGYPAALRPGQRYYDKREYLANGSKLPDGWIGVQYQPEWARWIIEPIKEPGLTCNPAPAMTILQLGCGRKKTLDAIGFRMNDTDGKPYDDVSAVTLVNLDMLPHVEPDLLCELGVDPIGLPDDSVDLVVAMHVLEHIGRQGEIGPWFYFWQELYRVLKPNGVVTFECPYHASLWAWADPTHTRAISEMSFLYLNQDAYKAPGTAMPDYRPQFDFVQAEALQLIPDHTNATVREREPVSFIRGRLLARKPLRPYWTD